MISLWLTRFDPSPDLPGVERKAAGRSAGGAGRDPSDQTPVCIGHPFGQGSHSLAIGAEPLGTTARVRFLRLARSGQASSWNCGQPAKLSGQTTRSTQRNQQTFCRSRNSWRRHEFPVGS